MCLIFSGQTANGGNLKKVILSMPRLLHLIFFFAAILFPATYGMAASEKKSADSKEASPAPTPPEVVCTAHIFFAWREEAIPENIQNGPKEKSSSSLAAHKEFYTTIQKRGASEAEVLREVNIELSKVLDDAVTHCRTRHENKSNCLSEGFRNFQQEFAEADFQTRELLKKSVEQDCAAKMGFCLPAEATQPACATITGPGASKEENEKAENVKAGEAKK